MAAELAFMEESGVFERVGGKQQFNLFDTFFRIIDDFNSEITQYNSKIFYSIDSRTNNQALDSPDRNILGFNESVDDARRRLLEAEGGLRQKVPARGVRPLKDGGGR